MCGVWCVVCVCAAFKGVREDAKGQLGALDAQHRTASGSSILTDGIAWLAAAKKAILL